jgi:hypothetical protein
MAALEASVAAAKAARSAPGRTPAPQTIAEAKAKKAEAKARPARKAPTAIPVPAAQDEAEETAPTRRRKSA